MKNPFQGSWSPDRIRKYIGSYQSSYFAYASDPAVREKAASGGVISAILIELLADEKIDGALLCRSEVVDGAVQPFFYIAHDEETVLLSQGSKYIAVNFNRDALPLIRDFQGRLAVVALPCDITKLQAVCEQDGHLAEKIALMISLFCGHNSLPELTQLVVEKMHPPASKLTHFRYRQGHWRGDLLAEFDNGQVISKPFSVFSNYQNLFFFCQQKCHHCHDHCGYHSDISMGDIWSRSMKKNPIKHSAAIIRSERGEEVFKKALETGILTGREVDISAVCQGQSRSMPFHYNLSARALAGKRLGFKIKDTLNETVRWNDWLAARMVLWNEKISRSSCGKRFIRCTPQFILRLYLLVLKGLQSF